MLRERLACEWLCRFDTRKQDGSRSLDVVIEHQVAAAVLEVQPVCVVVSKILELHEITKVEVSVR